MKHFLELGLEDVLEWFNNHIMSLNETIANCDSDEVADWQQELEEAQKMRLVLSMHISQLNEF